MALLGSVRKRTWMGIGAVSAIAAIGIGTVIWKPWDAETQITGDGYVYAEASIADPEVDTLVVRGEDIAVDDSGVGFGLNDAAPALLMATTDDVVTATAIALRFDGLDPAVVDVDATSSAFAMLVTSPPFVTDDPGAVLALRIIANESPHLDSLAAAIDLGDTAAQTESLGLLQQDVAAAVDALVAAEGEIDLSEITQSMGMSAPSLARPSGASDDDEVEFVPKDLEGDGLDCVTDQPTGDAGMCIEAMSQDTDAIDDEVDLSLVNRSRGWQAIVEVSDEGDITHINAVIEPRRLSALDGGTALAEQFLNYWASLVVDGLIEAGEWACEQEAVQQISDALQDLGNWMPSCDEDHNYAIQFLEMINGSIDAPDALVWDPEGQATVTVSETEEFPHTVLLTSGFADSTSVWINDEEVAYAQVLLTMMTAWTSYVEPMWGLVTGVASGKKSANDDNDDSQSGTNCVADSVSQEASGANVWDDLLTGIKEYPGYDNLLDIQSLYEEGAILEANNAAFEASINAALDPDFGQRLFRAFVGECAAEVVDAAQDALKKAVQKQGTRANAMTFIVTTSADLIFALPSINETLDEYTKQSRHIPVAQDMPALWWYVARQDHEAILEANAATLQDLSLSDIRFGLPTLGTTAWSQEYINYWDGTPSEGTFPAFWPFGYGDFPETDYPGTTEWYPEDGVEVRVVESAPPYFSSMEPFVFAGESVSGVGGEFVMEITAITPEPLVYVTDEGTSGAWVIAVVNTDAYTVEPQLAICRFHIGIEGFEPLVDGIYCDQAVLSGTELEPMAYWAFWWYLDGDVLVEDRWVDDNSGPIDYSAKLHQYGRGYQQVNGDGVLAPVLDYALTGDVVASWRSIDSGVEPGSCFEYNFLTGDEWMCGYATNVYWQDTVIDLHPEVLDQYQ